MFCGVPDCLKELIGMRARCQAGKPAPKCGLYIDDLPGIDYSALSHIANRDTDETAELFFERTVETATVEMGYEVIDKLYANRLTVQNDLHSAKVGWLNSMSYNSPTALNRGIRLRKKQRNTPMQVIFINNVTVLTNSTGTATVTIYDGTTQVSETVNVLPGVESVIEFNYVAKGADVKILMPNNQLATADTWVTDRSTILSPCCGGCSYVNDAYLEIAGWNGNGMDSKTYGLSADIGVKCDVAKLFCVISAHFGMALRYRVAINIAEHALYSSRLNDTINDKDQWEALKKDFSAKYEKALATVVQSSQESIKNYDKSCVTCNGAKISNVHF